MQIFKIMSTYTTVKTNADIVSNLVEIFDLVLKAAKVRKKSFRDVYYFDTTVYNKNYTLGKKSVNLINSCLLNNRFEEAAKLLWVMCQDRSCFDSVLYKGIMVVLENLMSKNDRSRNDIVAKFSSDIQDQKFINKFDVQLEYLIYALRNNVEDLGGMYTKITAKRRKQSLKKNPHINNILTAYCALLDYITWHNSYKDDPLSTKTNDIADITISSFKKILIHPGIWDIFVLKLIEMLECYEKYEEIEDILKNYIEVNPEHINGYIYLCVHLHKHNEDPKIFIQYSKILAQLCPSDVRVLLLVQKWNELGKKLKERLKILFMFLDYPVNAKNVLGWQMLASHLPQAVISKKSSTMEVVESSWNLRCHVWNFMYFNSSNICSGIEDGSELVAYKVNVVSMLNPDHDYIKEVQKKYPDLQNIELIINETLFNSEGFQTLYNLDNDISTRD